MQLRNPRPATAPHPEDGYLLLTVLVLIFLVLLSLSVAAPRVAKEIQRDKESEAVQRGLQYQRAIKLYYKKFGAYPIDIKQLENTNQIRFLRKRYPDPLTGKDDWRLIHMGEAKVPPMGMFGQPLQSGLSSRSTGPGINGAGSGGFQNTNATTGTSGDSSSIGNSNSTGSANPGNSGSSFGNFGSTGSGNSGSSGSSFGSFGSTGSSPSSGSFGSTGNGGSPLGGTGSSFGSSNQPGNNSGKSFGGSGAPIVGIGLPLDKESMRVYHKQKKYSQWEFVYDPQQDMMNGGGQRRGGDPGTNPSGIGPGGTNSGNGSGFGNFGSSSGSGSGSGFGNFGSTPGAGGGSFGSNPGGNSPGTGGSGIGNPSPAPTPPTDPNAPQ